MSHIKVKVNDYVIVTEKAIIETESQTIRNIPVLVKRIEAREDYPLYIHAEGLSMYTRNISEDEVLMIITPEKNPEYFL